MKIKITYGDPIRYFIDDKEVTEEGYKALREAIEAERLAEMFESGQTPHCISDQTYMKGHTNGSQFEKCQHMGNYYRHEAQLHGGNTNGKRYISGLARFPGDPEAWVTGRDDIKRVIESRPGWSCQGAVDLDGRANSPAPVERPEVADDLLDKYTVQVASGLPNPERIDLDDLREQVKDRIKPRKQKVLGAEKLKQIRKGVFAK